MRENAGQPAVAASLLRCRSAGCPAFLALRCICIAACAALCVALVPVSVGVSPAALPYVHKSEALAVQTPQTRALAFLEQCAETAGLSINDYVLTNAIAIGGFTGYNILSGDVSYNADQTVQVLNKLVTTAEWPAWDDLDEETKTAYGNNADLYHAQQFNTLAGCVGLGDARDVFYASGGDFDGETDSVLQRIGEIGNEFAGGAVIEASRLYSTFKSPDAVFNTNSANSFGAVLAKKYDYQGVQVQFMRSNPNFAIGGKVFTTTTWVIYGENIQSVSRNYSWGYGQSYQNPTWKFGVSNGNIWLRNPLNGGFFWAGLREDGSMGYSNGAFDVGITNTNFWLNSLYAGGYVNADNETVDLEQLPYSGNGAIPDAPSNVVDGKTQPEGIGAERMGPDTSYSEITGTPREPVDPPYTPPTPDERPQNPYNPSNPDNPSYQSGTPEWKSETMENMTPILNIRLHALFPFSLIYDLQLMWDRLNAVLMGGSELGAQAVDDYLHIRIPVNLHASTLGIHYDDEMVLDLTHLRDLLLTIKPFMAYLLSFSLLMGLISFWRRILTGA